MRNTSGLGIALLFLLAACGGKIAGEGSALGAKTTEGDPRGSGTASGTGSGVDPAPAPSPTPPSPSAPFGTPPASGVAEPNGGHTVEDACAAICERNAQCGADTPDCQASCSSEIHGASACAPQANAYIQCYASNLATGCAELPPVCEGAYCAYTICTGKVVPNYCGSR